MARKKIIFLITISILFVVIIFVGLHHLSEYKSLNTRVEGETHLEFKSERGFGNDRFDIYSFSLKRAPSEQEFQLPDDEFEQIYHDFSDMMDIVMGSEYVKLKEDIRSLKQADDLRVRIVHHKGTRELYLYSMNLNKGYYLILTI